MVSFLGCCLEMFLAQLFSVDLTELLLVLELSIPRTMLVRLLVSLVLYPTLTRQYIYSLVRTDSWTQGRLTI